MSNGDFSVVMAAAAAVVAAAAAIEGTEEAPLAGGGSVSLSVPLVSLFDVVVGGDRGGGRVLLFSWAKPEL